MNEHTFIIGSLAGTKAREMEPDKDRVPGEFKHFLFDYFMNEHSIKKRRSGIMKSELEDGCEDNPAEKSLPAVSLGLELNERSVLYQQLRDPDRTRDAALRELAERFHAERSVSRQAQEIRLRAVRYAASAWRFDRERGEMPERYRSTRTEHLWRSLV